MMFQTVVEKPSTVTDAGDHQEKKKTKSMLTFITSYILSWL